jgi:hypothetical protein
MGMRCSRIGCSGDAVATFCFDARATLVWVDTLEPDRGTGAGVLCVQHADALTPPLGWHLQDRRTGRPRLWEDRPAPPRRRRHRPAMATVDAGAADREKPEPGVEVASLPFDEPPAARSHLDELLDARTPLLTRAFASVRPS